MFQLTQSSFAMNDSRTSTFLQIRMRIENNNSLIKFIKVGVEIDDEGSINCEI